MKKILLATTAMVAFAGAASAEVALKGTGIISVIGGDGYANGKLNKDADAGFQSNVDVEFHMSGETDGGLAFGAKIDLDEAGLTNDANETLWVSGAFGKFTIGDTDSAIDWANAETTQGANLADDFTIHAGALANFFDEATDDTVARYEYAMGDFAVAASLEIPTADRALAATATTTPANALAAIGNTYQSYSNDPSWSVGATYNMAFSGGSVKFGAGYQNQPDRVAYATLTDAATGTAAADVTEAVKLEDTSVVAISARIKMDNGFGVALGYASIDNYVGDRGAVAAATIANGVARQGGVYDADQFGIGVDYTTGALTVGASYGEIDVDGYDAADVESYGVGASYDLGGGANVFAAMISEKVGSAKSQDKYQVGIALKF